MRSSELKAYLKELSGERGFSHSGWASLEKPISFEIYRQWIDSGFHGKMNYLQDHLPAKENPQTRFPFARSAFVFAMPYGHEHPQPGNFPLKNSRVASYAKGEDYHHWLKGRLQEMIIALKENFPDQDFEAHSDSSPLLERDLAVRAGLGWIGKNGCVIHPKKGSFFLIGEILTSLPFSAEDTIQTLPDFCGTCRRCIEICPTDAILPSRNLDARKCLSYLSIESRELPPEALRAAWGDWLFGCDLCQSVCPWNQKPFQIQESDKKRRLDLKPEEKSGLEEELRWILTSSGKTLEKAFRGTALQRAGSFGLKRNALVVAGNQKLRELRPEIESLIDHDRLGELAQWSLQQLHS